MTDVFKANQDAWNKQSGLATSPWVQPVDAETIRRARTGDWQLILTPTKVVPPAWFGDVNGSP
jgi:hypothetical protein